MAGGTEVKVDSGWRDGSYGRQWLVGRKLRSTVAGGTEVKVDSGWWDGN